MLLSSTGTANSYHHKRFMSAPSEFSHITDQINDEGQLTTVAQLTNGGEQFRTVTDVVSGLRKNVIMTCVNRGFLPLLINLLYSIQQLNIRNLPPILIICEDQEAYLEMSKVKGNFSMNMLLTLTNMNESVSEATAFKSDDYKNLVQKRVSYIGIFLQSGINIFYIDSDIVLLENPFSFFRGNFDLFIQNELPGKTDLCTGFFYLRANERTVALVQAWEELLPTDPSGNQRVFNIVVRKMRNKKVERKKKLKLKVLPMDRFLSGKVFRLSGNQSWIERNPKPVEIHANFLVGIESKIDMLKNNDLWFVEH